VEAIKFQEVRATEVVQVNLKRVSKNNVKYVKFQEVSVIEVEQVNLKRDYSNNDLGMRSLSSFRRSGP
jgi:hypothetical protein